MWSGMPMLATTVYKAQFSKVNSHVPYALPFVALAANGTDTEAGRIIFKSKINDVRNDHSV